MQNRTPTRLIIMAAPIGVLTLVALISVGFKMFTPGKQITGQTWANIVLASVGTAIGGAALYEWEERRRKKSHSPASVQQRFQELTAEVAEQILLESESVLAAAFGSLGEQDLSSGSPSGSFPEASMGAMGAIDATVVAAGDPESTPESMPHNLFQSPSPGSQATQDLYKSEVYQGAVKGSVEGSQSGNQSGILTRSLLDFGFTDGFTEGFTDPSADLEGGNSSSLESDVSELFAADLWGSETDSGANSGRAESAEATAFSRSLF